MLIEHGELIYGLAVAVDIENFSKLNTLDQYTLQSDLADVLDMAARRADLNRDTWYRQVLGDGELAVLPADTDVAWVVARYAQELERALCQLKASNGSRQPLRLRVAMHYGTLTRGRFGPVGQAPIVVSRLLDADAVRRALAQAVENDVVLVVSAPLYRDVVETRFYGLDPAQFRSMRVTAKGTIYKGYLSTSRPIAMQDPCGGFHDEGRRPILRSVPRTQSGAHDCETPALSARLHRGRLNGMSAFRPEG